jgi:hypothetical protein
MSKSLPLLAVVSRKVRRSARPPPRIDLVSADRREPSSTHATLGATGKRNNIQGIARVGLRSI